MQLANGKIKKITSGLKDYKEYIYEDVLFMAETDAEIEYMQFVNNTDSAVTLNVWIQYLENQILLFAKNYELDTDEVLSFEKKLYLKPYEKILATISENNSVDYFINGTGGILIVEPEPEPEETEDIPEPVTDGGYGENYGEAYGD